MRVSSIVGKYAQIGLVDVQPRVPVDINLILRQLTGVFSGGQGDVAYVLELDDAMPSVTLSADSFKQVVINLLKNAVEAFHSVPSQGKRLLIQTYSAVNVGGTQYVEIAITDNGPGISPAIKSRLFEPNITTKEGGRGGLGLSIVKQLVDDMQGIISCRSPVSKSDGTCFQILIPLQRAGSQQRFTGSNKQQ